MTSVRRATALFAAVALSLSLGIAPAVAVAKSLPAWACGSDAVAAAPASAARGGITVREKSTGQTVKPLPANAQGKAPADFAATVPVYFHVITDGATGALTDAEVGRQIRVLNNTFGGGEGGANAGFTFTLAGITRTDNAVWFRQSERNADAEMKLALKQGGNDALNVYTVDPPGLLGYAYYPEIVTTSQAYLDGVVLNWQSLPNVSDEFEGAYDQGETLTHETGHWLNLAHTFEGGCSGPGDFVDDTPYQKTPTGGCPEGKDTCKNQPGLDPIHNYMDYSYDSCYTEFTAGQVQRMRDAWLFYRAP
jgi:Pregnancy-associated plasma protein-A